MKVRIRRAYSKDVWYANKIGEEFEVEIVNNFTYSTEINSAKHHIDMFDCEVIPYEPVLIAEQPKEKTLFVRLLQSQSHVWHYSKVGQIFEVAPFDKDCYLVVGVNPKEHGFNEPLFISHSDCKVLASSGQPNLLEVKDNQLFTAAVAAMQGMLFQNFQGSNEDMSTIAWDIAEALINEGKKRGKL